MVAAYTQNGDVSERKCCKKRILSMIAILVLAVILGIVATATIRMQHASANADPLGSVYGIEHRDEFAGSPLQGTTPEIDYVWAAWITVEDVSDSTGTRMGYVSGTDDRDEGGSLEPAQFTHDGEDYTVRRKVTTNWFWSWTGPFRPNCCCTSARTVTSGASLLFSVRKETRTCGLLPGTWGGQMAEPRTRSCSSPGCTRSNR